MSALTLSMAPLRAAVLLLAGALMLPAAPAAAADKPLPPVAQASGDAMWWGDFDALERQHAQLRQPGALDADGLSRLALFRDGVLRVLERSVPDAEAYRQQLDALTLEWARAHPASAFAHVLHAKALSRHGWAYRGLGAAQDTPPQAMADFLRLQKKAMAYLEAHADVAYTDSEAHALTISIGKSLGMDQARMASVFQDGLRRNPDDTGLYVEMMIAQLPAWGGSPQRLDAFIRASAEQTGARYGSGMYALLYDAAAVESDGHALFARSLAEYPRMKQGYLDLLKRFPDSVRHRNRLAYFACIAADKATSNEQLRKLGDRVDPALWGENGARTLDGCKR